MNKCSKVKNPCKICLQSVTNKTGVQCKGACKKWAHYTCLNYTPGKIKDIKAGLITITCPCPNCNVAEDKKEFLTNPPYSCNYEKCPANIIPKCEIEECPANKLTSSTPAPIPATFLSRGNSPQSLCNPYCADIKLPDTPVKETAPQQLKDKPPPVASSKSSNTAIATKPDASSPPPEAVISKSSTSVPPTTGNTKPSVTPTPPGTAIAAKPSTKSRQSKDINAGLGESPKSRSCSCLSGEMIKLEVIKTSKGNVSNDEPKTLNIKSGDGKISRSDSTLITHFKSVSDKALLCTIHELCSTVGHLSDQIKNLMCKLIKSLESSKEKSPS